MMIATFVMGLVLSGYEELRRSAFAVRKALTDQTLAVKGAKAASDNAKLTREVYEICVIERREDFYKRGLYKLGKGLAADAFQEDLELKRLMREVLKSRAEEIMKLKSYERQRATEKWLAMWDRVLRFIARTSGQDSPELFRKVPTIDPGKLQRPLSWAIPCQDGPQ